MQKRLGKTRRSERRREGGDGWFPLQLHFLVSDVLEFCSVKLIPVTTATSTAVLSFTMMNSSLYNKCILMLGFGHEQVSINGYTWSLSSQKKIKGEHMYTLASDGAIPLAETAVYLLQAARKPIHLFVATNFRENYFCQVINCSWP